MNTLTPNELATYRMVVGKAVQEGQDPTTAAQESLRFLGRSRSNGLSQEEQAALLREVKGLIEVPAPRRSQAADELVRAASSELSTTPMDLGRRLGLRLREAVGRAERSEAVEEPRVAAPPAVPAQKEDAVLRAEIRQATQALNAAMRPDFHADLARVFDAIGRERSPETFTYVVRQWLDGIRHGPQSANLSPREATALRDAAETFARISGDASPHGTMFAYSSSFAVLPLLPSLLPSLQRAPGILENAGTASTPGQKLDGILDMLRAGMRTGFGADLDRLIDRLGDETVGARARNLGRMLLELRSGGVVAHYSSNLSPGERLLLDAATKALDDVFRETGEREAYPFNQGHTVGLAKHLLGLFPSLDQGLGVFPQIDAEAGRRALGELGDRLQQALGQDITPLLDFAAQVDRVAYQAYVLAEAISRLARGGTITNDLVQLQTDLRELVRRTVTTDDRSLMHAALVSRAHELSQVLANLQPSTKSS